MPTVLMEEPAMRDSNFALLLSGIAWILCLRFAIKRVSYIDNGVEKLNNFWNKLGFSILWVVFIIILIGFAGIVIELVGIVIQKLAEFLALPVLYLLGLG